MFVIDFAAWGWPQWLFLAKSVVLILLLIGTHKRQHTINAIVSVPVTFFWLFVLYMGGFFS